MLSSASVSQRLALPPPSISHSFHFFTTIHLSPCLPSTYRSTSFSSFLIIKPLPFLSFLPSSIHPLIRPSNCGFCENPVLFI